MVTRGIGPRTSGMWFRLLATGSTLVVGAWALLGGALTAAPTAASSGNSYTALSPCRVLDTRSASGPTAGAPLAGGATVAVPVTGTFCGQTVPSGAVAVVLNATATAPTKNGFLTLYPSGTPSTTSNVNFGTGQTVANLTTIQVGTGGSVTVANGQAAGGTVHVVLDLEGYYAAPGTSAAGQYVPMSPVRIADTRSSSGCPNQGMTIGAGMSVAVQVTGASTCGGGASGIPSSGVSAVVFNLTATDVTAGTFLTAYPGGGTRPTASNLNLGAGDTRPNRVIVPVGGAGPNAGQVSVYNANGTTDVIVDVTGYYTDSTASAGSGDLFTPIAPTRFEDTRTDGHTIAQGTSLSVPIGGAHGIPANAAAAVENVTNDRATTGSFFTVYPGPSRPLASDLNFGPNLINPNLVQATLNSSGAESIYNANGSADAIVDVFGYFSPPSGPPPTTYTVSAPSPSANPSVSTSGATTQGQVTYTVSGFTSTNTPSGHVDIALFPSTGANAPVNSSGTWTFTSSAGSGMAGSAAGEATSNNQTATSPSSPNQAPTNVPACGTAQTGCFAYISSVSGTATTNEPDLVKDVPAASGGTLTFTLNSFQVDGAVPVVFSEPSGSDTGTLMVGANGQPATGYPFGVGGAVSWQPAAAASGTYTNWIVQSVDNSAGTFVACDQNKSQCFTFTDTMSGDTYTYLDPSQAISPAQFQMFVSGPATQTNGLPNILGDELNITYSSTGPSMFTFSNSTSPSSPGMGTGLPSGQADVPAAPTGLTAGASTSPAGTKLTWTAPPNLDVTNDSSATYKVYRAPVSGGTVGTYATVATTPCSPASSTCAVDTTTTPGQTYSYVVSAVSGTMNGNVAEEGPASAAQQNTVASTAPISTSTTETPSGAHTTLMTGDALKVQFNQGVTLGSTWKLVLTDGTNVNTLTNANSNAAVSTTTITNDTVTYVVGAAGPDLTHGTNVSLMNLEALTQMGVGSSAGQWNLPGSAEATTDGGTTSQGGEDRVWSFPTAGSNSALPGGPTAGASAPNTVTVSSCTGTDSIFVYKTDGTYIGPATAPMCSMGTATVTTTTTLNPGDTILVTQEAANGYESLASPVTVSTALSVSGSTTPTAGTSTSYTLMDSQLADGSYTLCVGGPSQPCSQAGTPAASSPNGTAAMIPANVTFAGHSATVALTLYDATGGTLFFTVSGNGLTSPAQGSIAVTVSPSTMSTAYLTGGPYTCGSAMFTVGVLTQHTPTTSATQTFHGHPAAGSACAAPTGAMMVTIQVLDQYGNVATGNGTMAVASGNSADVGVGPTNGASTTVLITSGTGTLMVSINNTGTFNNTMDTLTFGPSMPYNVVATVSDS